MATNADTVVDDDKEVTEEDLHNLKYGSTDVETSKEEDETVETEKTTESSEETGEEDETNSDDQAKETDETETESDDSTFVKKFPNIKGDSPEEYAKNLEAAYENSTAEFHRLRQTEVTDTEDGDEATTAVPTDPITLFVKQKMDEEIVTAWKDFSKQYSQVTDQAEYDRFIKKVATLQKVALAEGRISPPKELYDDAAAALHWQAENKVDGKDRLASAVKDKAAVSKTSSATKPKSTQSKVSDKQVAVARMTWATQGQTDAQIRQELEAYV